MYLVEWSNIYDAEDEMDALRQAVADIEEAVKYKRGATCFFVSDRYGENKKMFDLEYDWDEDE